MGLDAEARLRWFVELIEDHTAVRVETPVPKYLSDEATRILDELYPGRTKT